MNLSAARKHVVYTELAKLTGAGFGIRQAAKTMRESGLPAPEKSWLEELDRGLEAGKSITGSFTGLGGLEEAIIGSGERGGRLGASFQHLADYYGMLAAARREIIRGMIYPLIVLHLGIIVGAIPLDFTGESAGGPSMLVRLLVTIVIVYAAGFGLFLGLRALARSAMTRPEADRMLNRIPLLGKARTATAMARFSKVAHACFLAGLPVSETLERASTAAQSAALGMEGSRLARLAGEGELIGPAMVKSPAFPKAFSTSYLTAEESGTLDTDLERWAKVYQEDAARAVRTLSVAVPKVMYFGILIFVGWKIVSFYQSYYGALDSL